MDAGRRTWARSALRTSALDALIAIRVDPFLAKTEIPAVARRCFVMTDEATRRRMDRGSE